MSKDKEIKTNAMRILDRNKVKYKVNTYECDEFIDGIHIADTPCEGYKLCYWLHSWWLYTPWHEKTVHDGS